MAARRTLLVWGLTLGSCFLGLTGCSAVRCQWRNPALAAVGTHPPPFVLPKRLAIAGWAPVESASSGTAGAGDNMVAAVLSQVAADFVKLRRNYLVYTTPVLKQHWAEACSGKVDGVLVVRALHVTARADAAVDLDLSAELMRCQDGALAWRVEGSGVRAAQDTALKQLTESYAEALGEPSRPYVAPAFGLLQALFSGLPDVQLTDDEVGEKIELGQATMPAPALAQATSFR
jgi:probable lipoprotein (TIGR04455 family)